MTTAARIAVSMDDRYPRPVTDGGKTRHGSVPGRWRPRAGVLVVGLCVVAAGLLIHYTWAGATADFLADALYAVLVYLIVTVVVPPIRAISAAGIACGICVLIEFAQLTDGPGAVAALFPPAVLVLGNTFAVVDLVAYAVGIAAAVACVVLIEALPIGRKSTGTTDEGGTAL
jgi:Protein of unknown function (DUF2809)